MKFTLNWLKDYLDISVSAQEVADKLTTIGLEIESLDQTISPIVAKIVECSDIPDTHLHLLKVNDGSGVLRQVVCGAPNAREGLVSALVLPGTKIQGHEIKVGKIRGYESNGMMCSEKELGISENHEGIIELDESKYTIGQAFIKNDDAVFDAKVTPNRPDYLSVRGIARDLSAAGLGKETLRSQELKNAFPVSDKGNRKVIIENTNACPIYRMLEIHGIKMAQSDSVISSRLAAIEINPKNVPIDVTNYVCYDIGQPMHCFDADQIKGDIIIRNAVDGEKFTDLFDTTHVLNSGDLVITDSDGILALAGIIGGKRGMTTDDTTNIIIESAYFDPIGIRKTGRRLGLSTDASYRYERGIDFSTTGEGAMLAYEIIKKECGGEIVGSATSGKTPSSQSVSYSTDLFEKKTGISLSGDRQIDILNLLGFGNTAGLESGKGCEITIPSWRPDVQVAENIVSELIRIYGYLNIKIHDEKALSCVPEISEIKQMLVGRGLNEVITYGFGNLYKEKLLSDGQNIRIKNPIIQQFDSARNSLVQNILDVIANNDRFKRSNLAFFELGTVFDSDDPNKQHNQLIIARTGILGDKIGVKHGQEVSIFDVRSDLLALFPDSVVENDDKPAKWAHPFRAGRLANDGKVVAKFAEVSPAILKKFGIKTNVVVGLVDVIEDNKFVQMKIAAPSKKYDLSEFPLITRDFAFIIDGELNPNDIVTAAVVADATIVEKNIFDIFDMDDGKKSVAFEVVIQPESNLSDNDLIEIQNHIIESVEKTGAKLRDK